MNRQDVVEKIQNYKRQYAQKYGIERMGLFGSVARDEAKESSDVDVCIQIKEPDPFVVVHIKEELEALLQRDVDIVRIRERMNPYLKNRIEKEAIYV